MKQTNIQFDFDAEKLEAIRLFLAQKDGSVEASLEDFMEQLYAKNVPTNVREYIAMRAGQEQPEAPAMQKPASSRKKRFEAASSENGKTPTYDTNSQT